MKSFVKIILVFLCVSNIFISIFISSCTGNSPFDLYDGEFLEKKLALPYNIEGVLSQNGERYDIIIESTANIGGDGKIQNGEFTVRFISGDVTEGLTVEFFEEGVFLFFDDLRFKTNSEIFTNLEALKSALETLGAPHIEKYVADSAPLDGLDILEIGVKSSGGDIKAYVNKLDGGIVRLAENLNGTDIILDVRKFENTADIGRNTDIQSEVFDVADDYINIYD
ncbi:MAG: hypothetical protein FWH10_00855 [Oscillospiraceae bacterium]|nr:hypothetical protein [Oscillospiraceae bacterium]